jgi:hypothetical protein
MINFKNTTNIVGHPVINTNINVTAAENTALMRGDINPKGAFTSFTYEYGTNINLGNKSNIQTIDFGFGFVFTPDYIVGLTKNTTYYYRLVAQNKFGKEISPLHTFRTTQNSSVLPLTQNNFENIYDEEMAFKTG